MNQNITHTAASPQDFHVEAPLQSHSSTRTKPTVQFDKVVGWLDSSSGGVMALLDRVYGHPNLGDDFGIRTSLVLKTRKDDNGNVIWLETRNTIYVQRKETPQ